MGEVGGGGLVACADVSTNSNITKVIIFLTPRFYFSFADKDFCSWKEKMLDVFFHIVRQHRCIWSGRIQDFDRSSPSLSHVRTRLPNRHFTIGDVHA